MLVRILIELLFFGLLGLGLALWFNDLAVRKSGKKPRRGKSSKKAREAEKKIIIGKIKGISIIAADFVFAAVVIYGGRHSVIRIDLPEGELKWSTERPGDALLCVPAAYSDKGGHVIGQYLRDGKAHGSLSRNIGRTSLKGDIFYADYKWLSDNGYQQHTIVLDSKPKTFVDNRYKVRRALCKKDGKAFILQSNLPMTLNTFAIICARKASNATNLDMGHCGYGYYKWHGITIPLAAWTYFTRGEQTNWLYIESACL